MYNMCEGILNKNLKHNNVLFVAKKCETKNDYFIGWNFLPKMDDIKSHQIWVVWRNRQLWFYLNFPKEKNTQQTNLYRQISSRIEGWTYKRRRRRCCTYYRKNPLYKRRKDLKSVENRNQIDTPSNCSWKACFNRLLFTTRVQGLLAHWLKIISRCCIGWLKRNHSFRRLQY